MKFRPCIDIHAGVVKQIVGSTLSASDDVAPVENFATSRSAADYAKQYRDDSLYGGHVIMLGPNCEESALGALTEFPQGLQIGGGITSQNAAKYIAAGASHIIVTSYVFRDGAISFERLQELVSLIGKDRVVIDLSCRRRADDPSGPFYVVTDKWTKYTDFAITPENLSTLSTYCAEFLVHGVDVEGKRAGIEADLVVFLGQHSPLPVTYAGGVRSLEDLDQVRSLGNDKVDCTVGSALDIFGGDLAYADVLAWHRAQEA